MKSCSVEGCTRKYRAKGFCATHYERVAKYGHPGDNTLKRQPQESICSVDGCSRESHAFGLCHNHYREQRRRAKGAVAREPRPPECQLPSCTRKHYSLGYCSLHYSRQAATGDVREGTQPRALVRGREGCIVKSCSRPHWSNGVCRTHSTTHRTYGISPEQLAEMLNRPCEICGSVEDLSIDHDHDCCPTGSSCGSCVRGTLCQKCNRGLGQFNDDQTLLTNAVEYLRRSLDV